MFLFFEPSLIQKKVLQEQKDAGGEFSENKTSELHNSEIKKKKKIKTRVK